MYVEHKFALSTSMKKKLRAYASSPTKEGITLRFKHAQLTGDVPIKITQTMKKKLDRAIAEGKGFDVHLSKATVKASMRGSGNPLQVALVILKPIQSIVGNMVKPEFKSKIDRYLEGNGVDSASKSEEYKKGVEYALQKKEEMSGSGWDEFWEGLKFGFSDPIGGLKVIGKSISDAINPPKKPEPGKTITWKNGEGLVDKCKVECLKKCRAKK
jgi:hypothetical protein